MASNMDILWSELAKHVEDLTTSGKQELDQSILKKIKRICRSSEDYVKRVYYLLMHQLEKEHAEIRYSSLLLCDELFTRSHQFRELLVSDFQTFLELTAEVDPEQLLPPPLPVAKKLKFKALDCVRQWHDAYAEGYKKLKLGYHFLQDCKKVDFRNLNAPGILERQQEEEKQKRQEIVNHERLQKCLIEIREMMPEIITCLQQIEECCKLMLPEQMQIFSDIDFNNPTPCCSKDLSLEMLGNASDPAASEITVDGQEIATEKENWIREHGLGNAEYKLTVEVKPENLKVKANSDNAIILSTLQESFKIANNKYSHYIAKWIKTIVKCSGPSDDLKRVIDLKNNVADVLEKCKSLGIVDLRLPTDSSEDEEEFEEVQTKEGYEPIIPQHLRSEYGLSSSNPNCDQDTRVTVMNWKPGHVDRVNDEMQDPTSAVCTLKVLQTKLSGSDMFNRKSIGDHEVGCGSTNSDVKTKRICEAPKLRFDTDLINWGEKRENTPSILKLDSLHRFWQPVENETQEVFKTGNEAIATDIRITEFSGQFVPVKWCCRAPLPSGKLCPRQDRYKCPFHGPVIPRDSNGVPSNLEDRLRLQKQDEDYQKAHPEWQDPDLLKDIEAATGIDLTIKSKKGKRSKKMEKKFPGLTDLNAHHSTVRKRLEKKVFDKSAVKRVAQSLDNMDYKKFKDKFGNQFNYSCET